MVVLLFHIPHHNSQKKKNYVRKEDNILIYSFKPYTCVIIRPGAVLAPLTLTELSWLRKDSLTHLRRRNVRQPGSNLKLTWKKKDLVSGCNIVDATL